MKDRLALHGLLRRNRQMAPDPAATRASADPATRPRTPGPVLTVLGSLTEGEGDGGLGFVGLGLGVGAIVCVGMGVVLGIGPRSAGCASGLMRCDVEGGLSDGDLGDAGPGEDKRRIVPGCDHISGAGSRCSDPGHGQRYIDVDILLGRYHHAGHHYRAFEGFDTHRVANLDVCRLHWNGNADRYGRQRLADRDRIRLNPADHRVYRIIADKRK